MGIEGTNRIVNPNAEYKKIASLEVSEYERRKKGKAKNNFKFFLQATTECSQCNRGMQKKIADEQIKNKRENAPICVPCILGIPRRPLLEVKKDRKHWTKESKIKFNKLRKVIHSKD